jgi:hypothetical protein
MSPEIELAPNFGEDTIPIEGIGAGLLADPTIFSNSSSTCKAVASRFDFVRVKIAAGEINFTILSQALSFLLTFPTSSFCISPFELILPY